MDTYDALFKSLKPLDPPSNLDQTIINQIKSLEKRLARNWLIFQSCMSSLSLIAVGFFSISVVTSFQQTGLGQYLALSLSEGIAGLQYWRELSLLIAESTPLLGIATLLGATGIFLWSANNIFRNNRTSLRQLTF